LITNVSFITYKPNNRATCFKDIEARFRPTDLFYISAKCLKPYFGAHGAEEIPVLIPNTEVKLSSGDYTANVGN
jgi:hypothetical protein